MGVFYRDSSSFKEGIPYKKINSNWKKPVEGWIKQSGEWRPTFLGLNELPKALSDVFVDNVRELFFNQGGVVAMALQSDGKILLGGGASIVNGVTLNRLIRLNIDGTIDTAFSNNLGTGFNNGVLSIAVQSNGQILVGGQFTALNGATRNRLVRLNSNGTEDTAFYSNLGTGFGNTVDVIGIQSGGQIIVGGSFTSLNNVTRNRLVRLNSNGTLDTGFSSNLGTGFGNNVFSLAIQSNDQILLGGFFTTLNTVSTNRLLRLNSNGTLDTAFSTNLGTAFNGGVNAIAVQSNGQILAGGTFSTVNGIIRNRLVRLNSNGTVDTAFYSNLGTGFNSTVISIAIQSDGKVLAGGAFTALNGATRNRLVRLNSNGTEDTAFYANLGIGVNDTVRSIVVQSDGKILLGGSFTMINNFAAGSFAILASTGALDGGTVLMQGFDLPVTAIAIQSDSKILVGGIFTNFNGVTRNRLVRLNSNGTLDTGFSSNLGTGFSGLVSSIAVQSNDQILVGGQFTTFNGATRNYLVRLNSNGTEDTAFYSNLGTGFNSILGPVAVQPDGKILVGGFFTALNGTTRNRLVRLNSNGTEDTAFSNNLGTGFGSSVLSIEIQSNGQIIVGGAFTNFNGVTRNRLVRLNSNGTLDTTFSGNLGTGFNSSVNSIAIQSNGQILVGGFFSALNGTTRNRLVRLNADGTLDSGFSSNLGTGFNGSVDSIAIQSNGQILVGGGFTTLDNASRNRLVRLNADGTIDPTFYANLNYAFNNNVNALVALSDSRILVGGNFTTPSAVVKTLRFTIIGTSAYRNKTFLPGLAGKFFDGTNWRNTIASGEIGSIPLTTDNNSVGLTGAPTSSLPSPAHLHGVNRWQSIGYSSLGDAYGFIAIGYFVPPTSGLYTFYTASDDGSGIWIGRRALNGNLRTASTAVVNNGLGNGQGVTERSGQIYLDAGLYYPIRVVHEELVGGDAMTLSYDGPGIAKTTNLSNHFRCVAVDGVITGDFL